MHNFKNEELQQLISPAPARGQWKIPSDLYDDIILPTTPPLKKTYTLAVGAGGNPRLILLNETFNPSTLDFLQRTVGDLKGKKVLDVGCGNGFLTYEFAKLVGENGAVVAMDIQQEQLDLTKQYMDTKDLKNVAYCLGDVRDFRFLQMQFDLVYCRFVLSHLQDVQLAIDQMASKVKPGGHLICEELAGIYSCECYPPSKNFEQWKEIFHQQERMAGTDFSIGIKLFSMFKKNASLKVKEPRIIQPMLTPTRNFLKEQIWMATSELKDKLVANGYYTAKELDIIIQQLKEFATQDNVIRFFPAMQIAAQKCLTGEKSDQIQPQITPKPKL